MSAIRFSEKEFSRIIAVSGCTIGCEFGGDAPEKVIKPHKGTPDGDFDSGEEYQRWLTLKLWERAGVIAGLERQIEYVLQEAFVDVTGKRHQDITYTADFRYTDTISGIEVVEDYKGYVRPEFRRTKKLFLARYPGTHFFVNQDIKGMYKLTKRPTK